MREYYSLLTLQIDQVNRLTVTLSLTSRIHFMIPCFLPRGVELQAFYFNTDQDQDQCLLSAGCVKILVLLEG